MSTQKTTHLERTAQEPRDEGLQSVTLSKIDQVNRRIRLFRLNLNSGPISFTGGQWLDTYIPNIIKPGGFTITSAPSAATDTDSPYLELAVQESPENPAAAWLWREPASILGSELHVRVGGSFVFPPTGRPPHEIRRIVFVAGGVGINPLVSMMGAVRDIQWKGDVRVLYASKVDTSLDGVLFLDRIAGLITPGKVQFFATGNKDIPDIQEMEKKGVEVIKRRFTEEDIKRAVGQDRDGVMVYVCGPPTMTDEMVDTLTHGEGALDKERVMMEKWW